MINIQRFRHIALVVHDLEKMIDFYCQTLGFELKRRFEVKNEDFRRGIGIAKAEAKAAHLTFPNSDVEMELFQFGMPQPEAPFMAPSATQLGYRHVALVVSDLQGAYAELIDKGIKFLSEPITMRDPKEVAGFQFVYFRDPEGNIVELNELPEWA
jgi:glyoxylase I family protein